MWIIVRVLPSVGAGVLDGHVLPSFESNIQKDGTEMTFYVIYAYLYS